MKLKRDAAKTVWYTILAWAILWPSSDALAQEPWTPEQREVLVAMERLSAATAPEGTGADGYGAVLAEDFSRWTVGTTVIDYKPAWVEGIREWFDDGWRVSDRQTQNLEILVREDLAFTRRIVEETYLGPGGDRSTSAAAIAEVWVRGDRGWLLFRVQVHPLEAT